MPAAEPARARQRRVPKQARSRELVGRILTAAGELFAERGYAGTNTNLVAERAGVSIGSLYQFFADKDEMLAALQELWTTRLGVASDAQLELTDPVDLAGMIDRVLDVHADLNGEPPGLLGFLLTTPMVVRSSGVADGIRQHLEANLEVLAPHLSPERRRVAAGLIQHIANGLYTLGSTAGAGDPVIRAEVRQALLDYIGPLGDRP